MKHWRTTLSGLVTAVFGFVAFSPALFARWPWLVELAKFVTAGGLVSMGLNATDKQNMVPPGLTAALQEWTKAQQGLPSAQDLDAASKEQSIAKGAS